MTISQLRRRIDALMRKFAPELAILKLRRIAEAVSEEMGPFRTTRAPRRRPGASPKPASASTPSGDSATTLRTSDARATSPEPESMVLQLLPWAWKDRYRKFLSWDHAHPDRLATASNRLKRTTTVNVGAGCG